MSRKASTWGVARIMWVGGSRGVAGAACGEEGGCGGKEAAIEQKGHLSGAGAAMVGVCGVFGVVGRGVGGE